MTLLWITSPMVLSANDSAPQSEGDANKQEQGSSSQDASNFSRKQMLRELKELYHSLEQLQKNAKGLLTEYNRADVRILEFGDFIENYMDDKPVPFQESLYPYGFQNFGNTGTVQGPPLPPRKQWVEHYFSNIKELLALSKSELNDVFTAAAGSLSKDDSTQCNKLMGDLSDAVNMLEKLTAQDKPDKDALRKTISNLIDDARLLQLTTKKSVRAIASRY